MSVATASPRIALVVPCFNEAARLDAGAFLAFARERADRRLCFVDDGSSDGTAARLAEIAAAAPDRIAAERLPSNRGKGEAVRAGPRPAGAPGARPVRDLGGAPAPPPPRPPPPPGDPR